MTDRINAIVVVLEENMRVDDVKPLLAAIQQMRGVLSVKENVGSIDDEVAFARARDVYGKALWDVILNDEKLRKGSKR